MVDILIRRDENRLDSRIIIIDETDNTGWQLGSLPPSVANSLYNEGITEKNKKYINRLSKRWDSPVIIEIEEEESNE